MSFATRARTGLSALLLASALFAGPALSQSAQVPAEAPAPAAAPAPADISESHLAAARDCIAAIRVTDRFDTILPAAAVSLKTEMLRQNPNLETLIDETVDEKALAMAGRRGDLEREAALAFARVFSEDELKAIAAFYKTPAGIKFIDKGPEATGEVYKAAEIWRRGIVRDLSNSVDEAMRAKAPKVQDPAAPTPSPDDQPAAPATDN